MPSHYEDEPSFIDQLLKRFLGDGDKPKVSPIDSSVEVIISKPPQAQRPIEYDFDDVAPAPSGRKLTPTPPDRPDRPDVGTYTSGPDRGEPRRVGAGPDADNYHFGANRNNHGHNKKRSSSSGY